MRQCKFAALAALVGVFVLGCERNGPPPGSTSGSGAPRSDTESAEGATAAPAVAAQGNGTTTDTTTNAAPATTQGASTTGTTDTTATGTTGTTASTDGAAPSRTPDVIYVPTPQPVVDKMLEVAKVKKGDVVYDLGCGDGRIVVTAAKKYGVKAFGFDIDPQRVAEAKENVKKNGVENLVTIEQKDIFTLDLSPASVVTLYLLPRLNVRLIPQLEKLKAGSRVVSHDFDMAGVRPEQHLQVGAEDRKHEVYLWTVPLKKEGAAATSTSK